MTSETPTITTTAQLLAVLRGKRSQLIMNADGKYVLTGDGAGIEVRQAVARYVVKTGYVVLSRPISAADCAVDLDEYVNSLPETWAAEEGQYRLAEFNKGYEEAAQIEYHDEDGDLEKALVEAVKAAGLGHLVTVDGHGKEEVWGDDRSDWIRLNAIIESGKLPKEQAIAILDAFQAWWLGSLDAAVYEMADGHFTESGRIDDEQGGPRHIAFCEYREYYEGRY